MTERKSEAQPDSQNMRAFVDRLAWGIVLKKLEMPALMFLEMHLPVTTIAHTTTLFFQPLLSPVFGAERVDTLSQFLAERKNVEALIHRIKILSEERAAA